MKLIQALLFTTIVCASFACKSHKNGVKESSSSTSSTQTEETTQNSSTSNTSATSQAATTTNTTKATGDSIPVCRLTVSFISIGAGTDPDGQPTLNKYIQQFMDASGKKIVYDVTPWGREGESDACFSLDNLTPEEQSRFINGMREAFKGRELVRVEENKKKIIRKK